MSNPFRIGDTVQWTSQSQGSTRTKTGKIIKVVPKNTSPNNIITSKIADQHKTHTEFGICRDHVSYLVSVPGKTATAKPSLMWPLVKKLTVVSNTTTVPAPAPTACKKACKKTK